MSARTRWTEELRRWLVYAEGSDALLPPLPGTPSERKREYLSRLAQLAEILIADGEVGENFFPVWVDERVVAVASTISSDVRSARKVARAFGPSFLLALRLLAMAPMKFGESVGDFVFNLAKDVGRWFSSSHVPQEMGVVVSFLAYSPALFGETEDLSPARNFPLAAGYCAAVGVPPSAIDAVRSFLLFYYPHTRRALDPLPDSVLHLSLLHFLARERLGTVGFEIGEKRGIPPGLLKLLPHTLRWEVRRTVVYRVARVTKKLCSPTTSRSPVL